MKKLFGLVVALGILAGCEVKIESPERTPLPSETLNRFSALSGCDFFELSHPVRMGLLTATRWEHEPSHEF